MNKDINILLIAKDRGIYDQIMSVLSPDYHMVLSESEESALKIVKSSDKYHWNLIIIDNNLPKMDGIGLTIYFHVFLNTKTSPIILLHDDFLPETLEDSIEAGVFDFLKKPLDETELRLRVKLALQKGAYLTEVTEFATKDSLTGLFNRRTFFNFFNKSFYASRRYHKTFSFAIFDIDGFKRVNDLHGHIAGDIVLSAIGKAFFASLRSSDTPGRIGGEEFAVIFDETSETEALKAAERIRKSINQLKFDFLDDDHVTISAGVTEFNPDTHHSVGDIFRDADTALYYSKNSGKNRITQFSLINIAH